MIADIEKMYRQILITGEHRDVQRIVWRENEHLPIQHYALNTVTHGTSSTTFLAIRSLQQTAIDYQTKYPNASRVIIRDFYVDDLISGASSIEEAQSLRNDLC